MAIQCATAGKTFSFSKITVAKHICWCNFSGAVLTKTGFHSFSSQFCFGLSLRSKNTGTLKEGCQHLMDSVRLQARVTLSPSSRLIHDSPCWQSESSTSFPDKSRGYHSSAAIYRTHLRWLTSIFQPLLKLALQSYFSQAFHLVRPWQQDFGGSLILLFLLDLCPEEKTWTRSRFHCICVCLSDYLWAHRERKTNLRQTLKWSRNPSSHI